MIDAIFSTIILVLILIIFFILLKHIFNLQKQLNEALKNQISDENFDKCVEFVKSKKTKTKNKK